MDVMTAWKPIPAPKEGTCETCRYLDRHIALCSYPTQYYCKLTGEANFLTHECDVSAFEMMKEE